MLWAVGWLLASFRACLLPALCLTFFTAFACFCLLFCLLLPTSTFLCLIGRVFARFGLLACVCLPASLLVSFLPCALLFKFALATGSILAGSPTKIPAMQKKFSRTNSFFGVEQTFSNTGKPSSRSGKNPSTSATNTPKTKKIPAAEKNLRRSGKSLCSGKVLIHSGKIRSAFFPAMQ